MSRTADHDAINKLQYNLQNIQEVNRQNRRSTSGSKLAQGNRAKRYMSAHASKGHRSKEDKDAGGDGGIDSSQIGLNEASNKESNSTKKN